MYKYVIIVEKAGENYSAYCPDLPGCVATGETVEGTTDRMKEAIEFHLDGMKKDGLSIPKPSTLATAVDIAIEG